MFDKAPLDWPEPLAEVYGDVWSDPAAWAARVKELGADLVNLRLVGTHPDEGDRSPEQAVETVKAVLEACDLPLIIWGCDVPAKDQKVMPKVAEAAQGENCLLGAVAEDDYRTLAAAAQAYGHKLIALAPCDINKAKQVNILVSDTGFPLTDMVIYPTTASLGYGMEYVYSILERGRLAALSGDRLMAQPVILDVGYEAWRAKEARTGDEAAEAWGPPAERGLAWEAVTATDLLQGGCDILVPAPSPGDGNGAERDPPVESRVGNRRHLNTLTSTRENRDDHFQRTNQRHVSRRAHGDRRARQARSSRNSCAEQVAGGADVMDINIGPTKGDPVENFVWLAQTVHEVTDKPLSLDSAKANLLVEVVPRVRQALPDTKLVINSCTAAPDYMDKLIPVAVENGTGIIGLTMDQEGVPGNVEKRVECGATFLMTAMEAG